MKKVCLAVSAALIMLFQAPAASWAEVNVSIGINLPALATKKSPTVTVIPGTYVYIAADLDAEVLFHGGHWWRPHKGRWYRSDEPGAAWTLVAAGKVPGVLLNLPPGYRDIPPGQERIPYGQLKKSWKAWEDSKHWDKAEKHGKHKGKERKKGGKD